MIRGTTAQFKFNLPYAKSELEWATIKFWQPGNVHPYLPITKNLENCSMPADSKQLCVSLTAEETARFSSKIKAKVQMRAKHASSARVFGSLEQLITVYPADDTLLEEDILPDLPTPDEDGVVILDGGVVSGEAEG